MTFFVFPRDQLESRHRRRSSCARSGVGASMAFRTARQGARARARGRGAHPGRGARPARPRRRQAAAADLHGDARCRALGVPVRLRSRAPAVRVVGRRGQSSNPARRRAYADRRRRGFVASRPRDERRCDSETHRRRLGGGAATRASRTGCRRRDCAAAVWWTTVQGVLMAGHKNPWGRAGGRWRVLCH